MPYEKPVILLVAGNNDPPTHAWAEARFVTDIIAEHALFFSMLMPPEVVGKEREEALQFSKTFTELNRRIDSESPPEPAEVKRFVNAVIEQIKPFIDYKARLGDAHRKARTIQRLFAKDITAFERKGYSARCVTTADARCRKTR